MSIGRVITTNPIRGSNGYSMSSLPIASVRASRGCSDGFATCCSSRDEYFLMADFASYIDTQSAISEQYQDRELWNRKAILNLARIGRFSSDRAVAEYARDIWRITPA